MGHTSTHGGREILKNVIISDKLTLCDQVKGPKKSKDPAKLPWQGPKVVRSRKGLCVPGLIQRNTWLVLCSHSHLNYCYLLYPSFRAQLMGKRKNVWIIRGEHQQSTEFLYSVCKKQICRHSILPRYRFSWHFYPLIYKVKLLKVFFFSFWKRVQPWQTYFLT